MTQEELKEIKKYENYPEGSASKALYDSVFMPFDIYLEKYYKEPDLKRWYYWTGKFVTPLFNGSSYEDYQYLLYQVKPPFNPILKKLNEFWVTIKEDNRFDNELKQFFTFLYAISFFKELSFEEWLKVNYWHHPWYQDENSLRPIEEILSFAYGSNYLKSQLVNLPSLNKI